MLEHISNPKLLGAKTLFATHYHELTELEGKIPGVNNYCIAVREQGDDIVFLRKIIPGGADKSYGIQVARLAGVPKSVTDRARELAEELSNADIASADRLVSAASEQIAPDEENSYSADGISTGEKPKKSRSKKPDQVDLNQMSFLETTTDADVLKELQELDVPNMTPMDALNTLYRMQGKLKNRWQK